MNLSTNDRGGKINEIKVNVDGAGTIGLPHKKKKRKRKKKESSQLILNKIYKN